MTLHCGREQMCDPCDRLPIRADQSTVCISVGEVISRIDDIESVAALKKELGNELQFWADDDDYVTKDMSEAALAALIELEPVHEHIQVSGQ